MGDVALTVAIDATPAQVWALIGDPTRMGEWSPECVGGRWLDGASEPAPGARFRGSNRLGWRRWSTVCTVTDVQLERLVQWDVRAAGPLAATWTYRLEPDGGATTRSESFTDRRGQLISVIGGAVRGVADVTSHNRTMVQRTLGAIKVEVETAG